MKNSRRIISALLLLLLSTLIHQPSTASAQGTAFTYQGLLTENGGSAEGIYDFHFTIHDSPIGGTLLGGPVTNSPTAVTDGLFMVTLDFGSGTFTGGQRWLEVSVRTNGGGAFTSLQPRQAVTPSPYAIHAAGVSATGITGTIAPANIGAGTITGTMLAPGSITSNNLAAGSVTSHSLSDGTVGLEKLDAVTVPLRSVTLVAPTPASNELFGTSVAAVGDDRLVVGAPGAREAYLFNAIGTLLTTFTNPAPGQGVFGSAAAWDGGAHVLIGASELFFGATTNAYLFTTNGTLIATFMNPTGTNDDFFGSAVAMLGTDKVVIGAPQDDTGGNKSGVAYLFSTNGTLLITYTNPAPSSDDLFGVAVAGIGQEHVLIGTMLGDEGGLNAGGAYLFHSSGALVTTFANPIPSVADNFGRAVAAFGGDRVLIGAARDRSGAVSMGSAYLYHTNGTHLMTFTNPAPANADEFGNTVAALGTDKVLVGAFLDDEGATDAGSGYLFDTNGTLLVTFANPNPIATNNPGGVRFGTAVAGLSDDRVIIGAPQDGKGGIRSGAAYIFTSEQGALMPGLFAGGVADGAVTPAMLSAEVGVWNRSGSNLFYTGGNVGVGTNTPASRLHVNGTLAATALTGNGAGLTALNASQLTSGTVPSGRLAGADGSGLIQLNASQLSSGTLPSGRLTGAYSSALTFNNPANTFIGNGAGLTALNASQLTSGTVPSGRLAGTYSSALTFNNPTNSFIGNGSGLDGVWKPGGNGGTTAGTHFLGTTDNQPLELKVNNLRALRLEPTTNDANHSNIVNVIGGSPANTVGAGIIGATISGGGAGNYIGFSVSNRVDADFGSIGGGRRNIIQTNASASTIAGGNVNTIQANASESTIGGGLRNTIQTSDSAIGGGSDNMIQIGASRSTIGGGQLNTIQIGAFDSAIGGGSDNTIQTNASRSTIGGGSGNRVQRNSSDSTIGGGSGNTIQSFAFESTIGGGDANTIQTGAANSAIGGGFGNTISGVYGTVPGGNQNVASGSSFAAGNRAKANHGGAFVWADSTSADFASTADNQFSIRATGGVRLSDNTPNLSFGSTTRQMLNLFSSSYGLGVQESTLYQRSNFRFSWFVGGTHSDSQNAPGAGGSVVMTLTSSGLTVNGSACCSSDRNTKENFTPVEPRDVLEKVAALPITRWNYKNDRGTPHLGPMSQDFYAAFGVGPDDKHIATVDADGVALAAIQGLNQKLEQKETEITELKQRLERLERTLNEMNGGAN